MKYNQQGRDTSVVCKNQQADWTVENRDFITVFFEEFEEILLHRELTLDRFKFLYNISGSLDSAFIREYLDPLISRFYVNLERILKLRQSKLNARIAFLQAKDMDQVQLILSQIDNKSIKFLWLGFEYGDDLIEIEELVPLVSRQWKCAKNVTIRMKMGLLTTKNLNDVRKLFFEFPVFNEIEIRYQKKYVEYLDHVFGMPNQLTPTNIKRSRHIPKTKEVLNTFERSGCVFRCAREKLSSRNVWSNHVSGSENMTTSSSNEKIDWLKVFENTLLMSRILEYVQCFEIQKLRKVSRGIRSKIDNIKPDANIQTMLISISSRKIAVLGIQTSCDSQMKNITYENEKERASPEYQYLEDLAKDVGINLLFQKMSLQVLELSSDLATRISGYGSYYVAGIQIAYDHMRHIQNNNGAKNDKFDQFLKMFEKVLKSLKLQLKVEKLSIQIGYENHLLSVLPYVDARSLKVIEIPDQYFEDNASKLLDIKNAPELEQWRQAEHLIIKMHVISTPIQKLNVTHFARGDITVASLSPEDILYLKEKFLLSQTLQKFKITTKDGPTSESLYLLLGDHHFHVDQAPNSRDVWYFRTSNVQKILHIVYYVRIAILFTMTDLSSVPSGVVLY